MEERIGAQRLEAVVGSGLVDHAEHRVVESFERELSGTSMFGQLAAPAGAAAVPSNPIAIRGAVRASATAFLAMGASLCHTPRYNHRLIPQRPEQ
jgi:hypothetical protein